MAVSYKKLWHILVDRNMKKKDLEEAAGITHYQMYKLANDKDITTDVIGAICAALKEHLYSLEMQLIDGLARIDFIRNGAKEHIPGNISLSFPNSDGEAILHRLDLKRICISTGSACDSVNTQTSHVIQAIGLPDNYATCALTIV